MDDQSIFLAERCKRIESYASNRSLQDSAKQFLVESLAANYSYNFEWLGMPIFQYPQDMLALQEIIWTTKPDCIVETGVARGGSLLFYASMLELLGIDAFVVGIDTRAHNRKRILEHPLSKRIHLVDGSSIAPTTVNAVRTLTSNRRRIMLCLDSNHTHSHVLRELELYAPLVAQGCYCVVFDTIIESMPKGHYSNRPWDKGNNPKTAVLEYLKTHPEFDIDKSIENKLLITAAPDGRISKAGTLGIFCSRQLSYVSVLKRR
jgi:cephalosporin hydroxylase